MRAIVITKPGGPEVLQAREIEEPVPGPDDLLVEVKATALNRADLLQRLGRYAPTPEVRADVLGLEMAGVVAATGTRVTEFKAGDRVFGLLGGGGYAQRVVIHRGMAARMPERLSFVQAAAVPEVFITAHDALFNWCGLQMGDRVLVHAVGSGVGTAAVQLARCAGAFSLGTAGSADKLSKAKALGLNVGINYRDEKFAEVVQRETRGQGVQAILDVVGAPYWEGNIASLAVRGHMVLVGTMGGAAAQVNLAALMGKRLSVHGTVLRARGVEEKIALAGQMKRHVLPLLESGAVQPVLDRVFPLEQAAEAHRYMESNANFGKIVLEVG